MTHNRGSAAILIKMVAVGGYLMVGATAASAAIPAFPGAEGAAAAATGGRGRDVYHVTNLNESGPGSFRDALSQSNRIVVFDVSGIIRITSASQGDHWFRTGVSNITIAGQTAPGKGIVIQGTGMKFTGTNVVLRNLSFRPGNRWGDQVRTMDGLWLQTRDSIFDHVSVAWASDEGISLSDSVANTTVQYSIAAEGLMDHSYGGIIGPDTANTVISFHHNLLSSNRSRNPRLGNEVDAVNVADFRYNVIYNQKSAGYSGAGQEGDANFVGNYYVAGPDTDTSNLNTAFSGSYKTDIYQSGNKIDPARDGIFNGADTGWGMFSGSYIKSSSPFPAPGITAQTADDALHTVLNHAGAFWWNRTSTDARLISDVRSAGTKGKLIYDPSEVGGWPAEPVMTRPANWDTDLDGMPDHWERAHGLNPSVQNHKADFDNDGYTDVEEYLNDLAAWPAPIVLSFTNTDGSGRYARIENWGNVWQPSRFDAAQINSGTVTVDAPGQHARTLTLAATSNSIAALEVTSGWIDIRQTLDIGSAGTASANQTAGLVRAGTAVKIGNASRPGTYRLAGGTLATPLLTKGHANSTFSFTGGVLHADRIEFSLINNGGTLSPGSDAQLQLIAAASLPDIAGNTEAVLPFIGSTHVTGNLQLLAGTLAIDLASPSLFDSVVVDGELTLGGALSVALNDGYLPSVGQQWLIARAANIHGGFASITEGYAIRIDRGSLYLVAVPEPAAVSALGLGSLAMLRQGFSRRRQRPGRHPGRSGARLCISQDVP